MVELGSSQEVSLALVNAILLALWPVLPGLLLGYARKALAVRHIRPEFSLRKSEALELDRAVRLYEDVRSRLKTLENQGERSKSLWEGFFGKTGLSATPMKWKICTRMHSFCGRPSSGSSAARYSG